jgi:hypothetical protein
VRLYDIRCRMWAELARDVGDSLVLIVCLGAIIWLACGGTT